MPGPFELIIILVIVLLIFGGKRLKNLGGDLGGAIKGFKSAVKDEDKTKSIDHEGSDSTVVDKKSTVSKVQDKDS